MTHLRFQTTFISLDEKVKIIIIGTRTAEVAICRCIVMDIVNGMVRLNNWTLLKENGGQLELTEDWALRLNNRFQRKGKSCLVWDRCSELLPLLILGSPLTACPETLARRPNVASSSLFYSYYFGRYTSELVKWFHFFILGGNLLVILLDCQIFLSPFLDVIRNSLPI